MHAFSTPFDASAVDFLETLNVPAYKIASFECTDLPLVRKAARTGKPLIISTGMATLDELDETVRAAREAGCEQLVLLKCTSAYPAPPETANLRTLPNLRERFDVEVGLSDHTPGVGAAVTSIALGARLVEKHFTLARADGGVDSSFSLEPPELRALVDECERAFRALGTVSYGPTESDKPSLVYRRSLYIAVDMNEGDVLTERSLRALRPGFGLPPKHYDELLGRPVRRAVKAGTPVTWDLVK
jgi:N-acetylneuraminate synthase